MSEKNSENNKNKMERGLKNRHVQIIAIAGTIGTGVDRRLYVFDDAGDWRDVVL